MDYKILTSTLATRLRNVLPFVLDEDQTCGVPGCSINENISRLKDMADMATKKGSLLINLDQEKAFDRVDRHFLKRILERMNFGPSFRHWITIIYEGAKAQVINNGHFSDPIYLMRGLQQGCPLSPLLYMLVIETLAATIRANPNIQGIQIPRTPRQSKISAYADDGTLTLRNDASVIRSFDVVDRFEAASSGKLNYEKTEGIYVGQHAGREHGPVAITWKPDNITVLGCKIGNDMQQDWNKVIERTEKNLERWSARKLMIKGKSLIIKTFAIANLMFLASLFPVPVQVTERITRAMFHFLWSGKNERVARETLYLPFEKGGLAVPDLQQVSCAALVKWVKKIVDRKVQALWVNYARYWIGMSLSMTKQDWELLRSNLKPHADPMMKMPKWYEQIVKCLQEHQAFLNTTADDNLTSKTIRKWLQPDVIPRASREWKRIVYPAPGFFDAWVNMWTSLTTNIETEFLWQMAHRVLPTRAYLVSW